MAEVFISYSRKDSDFAKRLTGELKKNELEVWIDWEDIQPTVDWRKEIRKGIERVDAFIFLISPDSAESPVCKEELDIAIENGKRLIPIIVRDVPREKRPEVLKHLNFIYFRETDDFNEALQKLLTAIRTDFEWVATLRDLQGKALEWKRHKYEKSFLLRGTELQDAESQIRLNKSKEQTPTELQKDFIAKSRKVADNNIRAGYITAIVAVIIFATLAVWGWGQAVLATNNAATAEANLIVAQTAQVDAKNNAATAIANEQEAKKQATISHAGELASLGLSEMDNRFDLALLFGLQSFHTLSNQRTESTLFTLTNSYPNIKNFLWGHTATVTSVAYSPDGKRLASGSKDNSIILWDFSNPNAPSQLATLTGHTAGVTSLAFSPDGKRLAAGSEDRTIILWDISDPSNPSQLVTLSGYNNVVTSIAFSPNGNLIASGDWNTFIVLWDIGDLKNPLPLAALSGYSNGGHYNTVSSVAFSPDGKRLASGSWDSSIILWDISNPNEPTEITTLYNEYYYGVTTVAFSPKGNRLASGGWDNSVLLWDLNNLDASPTALSGHKAGVTSVAFSSDGNQLASGSEDKSVIVWDVSNPNAPKQTATLSGHSNVVTSVAFNRDGKQLATGSWDTSIIVWNINNSTPPSQIAELSNQNIDVGTIAFSRDGKRLASGNKDGTIILWDLNAPDTPSPLFGKGVSVYALAFSPDGNQLISGGWRTSTILWDVSDITNPTPLATLAASDHIDDTLAFSPNGNLIAAGSENTHSVTLWEVSDPSNPSLLAALTGHSSAVTSVAFSPDGKQLASSSRDKSIILWDISDPSNPSQLATLTGDLSAVTSVAFSADGNQLASGSEDETITLWDISNPDAPSQLATLTGHDAAVYSVAFSPDGRQLASGSEDRSIILWDVSNPELPYPFASLSGYQAGVKSIAFGLDGKELASGSNDKTIKVWDTDTQSWVQKTCQRIGRNFTQAEWTQYFGSENYQKTCDELPVPSDISTPPTIAMRALTGFDTNNVNLNGVGTSITVPPGSPINITYNFQVYSDPCPGCIAQLVTGLGQPGTTGDARKCAYIGVPGPFPGEAGTEDIVITAPTTPGTYPVVIEYDWQGSCEDARKVYGTGSYALAPQVIGQVIVSASP